MDWLKELEAQIRRAGEEIAALRKQNRALGSQVKRLRRAAQESVEAAAGDRDEERLELRRRVEKIASTLESILDES